MKQFIHKLRMAFCLMNIFGFWYISVSGTSSMPDGRAKSFPDLYRCPMDVPKVFQASIDARWTCQKFSRPLSMPDGRAKSFPSLYRSSIGPPKDFRGGCAVVSCILPQRIGSLRCLQMPQIFLISASLVRASRGVMLFGSSPLISSRICESTGSSSWKMESW